MPDTMSRHGALGNGNTMTMNEMLLISPRIHDLGEFVVRRLLPFAERRMVGPFIFFDHMGPVDFTPGQGINVRPHPHIGLATLTFLFEGQILHRDCLGTFQPIESGDVNWMVAGQGITHSERTSESLLATGQRLHGLQLWIALPTSDEEMAPEFHHYQAEDLPRFTLPGVELTLVAGSAYGHRSPVKVFSPMMMLDVKISAGASFDLPKAAEKALYLVDGTITADGATVAPHEMASWIASETVTIVAQSDAHLVLLGGDKFDEARFIEWNFVSSRRERLNQAKADWRAGRFAKIPGDDIEFIPLPD
jgi:redox-sensitive bicupin YhaK (pirin superfamily)